MDKVDEVKVGHDLFRAYCVNCHGEQGRGDGPLATILKVPTPDLTIIAERNAGVFPIDVVRKQINGMEFVLPHGTGLMPVWGVVLNPDFNGGEVEEDGREVAGRQIEALLAYVKSIQEEGPQ